MAFVGNGGVVINTHCTVASRVCMYCNVNVGAIISGRVVGPLAFNTRSRALNARKVLLFLTQLCASTRWFSYQFQMADRSLSVLAMLQ